MQIWQEMGLAAKASLLVGIVPMIMGAGYAIWPSESKLALMRPLSLAGIFSGLSGFVIGLINGLQMAARNSIPLTTPAVIVGITEAMVPLLVAFGSLTAAWLMVALGMTTSSVWPRRATVPHSKPCCGVTTTSCTALRGA